MDRILPALMIIVPSMQVIVQYVCVVHHDDIAMPGFLVFPLMGVDAIASNLLIYTFASFVHNDSEKLVKSLERKFFQGSTKWSRSFVKRMIKSLTVLKIKFGANFIDRGTPLIVQNFCITRLCN